MRNVNTTGQKTDKAYLKANENAVRKAFGWAQEHNFGNEKGVTVAEVKKQGRINNIKAPIISGWIVWDFTDRVRRYLDRLVRKGELTVKKQDRKYMYSRKIEE